MKKKFKRIVSAALICLLLLALLPASALAADGAAEYIRKAQNYGWIETGEAGEVSANEAISRADFSVSLWRALGEDQPTGENPFADVAEDASYAAAVTVLYEKGVINGVGGGLFAPDAKLTREMGITMLARAFRIVSAGNACERFADAAEISGWAKTSVSALAQKGYVANVGDNRCAPQSALTWGETAEFLVTVYEGETNELRFDYTEEIAAANFKNTAYTTPKEAAVDLTVESTCGATGVVLVNSDDAENTKDLFLNAYVAGDTLTVSGSGIAKAVKEYKGTETPVAVVDNKFTFVPETLTAENYADEVIHVTLTTGEVYNIHTVPEKLPLFEITADNKPAAGVYSMAIDSFMIRVNTDGEIVYFRAMNHQGKNVLANFEPHDLDEGRYYTYFYETNTALRDPANGYNSGMFVLMDSNYTEVEYITLLPTERHGEGYLDQHEILLLSPTHWMLLSYTCEYVNNIPAEVAGSPAAYVQAGIIQEVENNEVIMEIDSVDYPEFYALAMTSNDYASSTVEDLKSICDYVHPNSIDIDERDGNIIVSMRSMSSIVKFDRETGEIVWILGGRGNEFTGLDELIQQEGILFLYQHNAKYVSESVTGNKATISLFDNETNFGKNLTRTLMIELDEETKTGKIVNVITGSDYDAITGMKHWGTHCGNVEYITPTSAVVGWGLHVKLDTDSATLGVKPVLSEINPETGELLFELVPDRNPNNAASMSSFMSYRAYKTAD